MSDSREQAYDAIIMPRVSKIREAIGEGAQSEGTSSVADTDDDPTEVLEEGEGVGAQSERTSSVADTDDDPTNVRGSRGPATFQKSLMGVANEDDDPTNVLEAARH